MTSPRIRHVLQPSVSTVSVRTSSTQHAPIVTRTGRAGLRSSLQEIWHYRDVLYFLVWRDIKVRYKQTVLGVAWAVLQPLLTMVVFSVFLGGLAGVSSDGLPYSVFVFCALIPWQLFAHALITSGNSLVANQELISKVYFPRVFLPVAPVVVGLVDFGLAFLILLAMMLWHGIMPGPAVLVLPPLVIFAIVTALAVGIWLSAVNLRYRDVGYTLPFLSQLWLFATPVAYSSSIIPESWRGWYGLNPMVGVIEGFRWALLGVEQTSGSSTLVSLMVVTVLLAGGLRYFQASERQFADVV